MLPPMISLRVFICASSLFLATEAQFFDLEAASLGNAPVGFYSRGGAFGDRETVASLGNAPVGVYHREQYLQPFYPVQRYPVVQIHPQKPGVIPVTPRSHKPVYPPPPRRPVYPPYHPPPYPKPVYPPPPRRPVRPPYPKPVYPPPPRPPVRPPYPKPVYPPPPRPPVHPPYKPYPKPSGVSGRNAGLLSGILNPTGLLFGG